MVELGQTYVIWSYWKNDEKKRFFFAINNKQFWICGTISGGWKMDHTKYGSRITSFELKFKYNKDTFCNIVNTFLCK